MKFELEGDPFGTLLIRLFALLFALGLGGYVLCLLMLAYALLK